LRVCGETDAVDFEVQHGSTPYETCLEK